MSDRSGPTSSQRPLLEKPAHSAGVTLGVLEEYRGNDVGGHLLQRALSRAAREGYHEVYNSAPATNRASIEFLETRGWNTEAIRRGHYRIDGEFVDEVMGTRLLDE